MSKKSFFLPLLFACWCISIAALGLRAWGYDFERASTEKAGPAWPKLSELARVGGKDTLVMAIHPACPCSRASLAELERAAPGLWDHVDLDVVFFEPPVKPAGWDSVGLWERASGIPGARVIKDREGRELRRFGMTTSGEVKLFDEAGKLLFHGGITESRGHEGENPGLDALLAAVRDGKPASKPSPVFGCAIFSSATVTPPFGSEAK